MVSDLFLSLLASLSVSAFLSVSVSLSLRVFLYLCLYLYILCVFKHYVHSFILKLYAYIERNRLPDIKTGEIKIQGDEIAL